MVHVSESYGTVVVARHLQAHGILSTYLGVLSHLHASQGWGFPIRP